MRKMDKDKRSEDTGEVRVTMLRERERERGDNETQVEHIRGDER